MFFSRENVWSRQLTRLQTKKKMMSEIGSEMTMERAPVDENNFFSN